MVATVKKTASRRRTGRNGDGRLKVEYVPLAKLKLRKDNPRQNEAMVGEIVASIEHYGYTNPILVRRANGEVVAGHTRVMALRERGETAAPVIYLDLTAKQAKAYRIFDNRSVEKTQWDIPTLAAQLEQLTTDGVESRLLGFTIAEIEAMKPDPNYAGSKDDEIPKPPKKAVTKPGDRWTLGNHHLLCGDARNKDNVTMLAAGQMFDMVATSPPYNVGMKYRSHNDKACRRDYLSLIEETARIAFDGLTPGRFIAWNIGVSPKTYPAWQVVTLENIGFNFYRQIVWEKAGVPYPIFGSTMRSRRARHYKPNYTHEVIAVLEKPDSKKKRIPCPLCKGDGSVDENIMPLREEHELIVLMTKGQTPELGGPIVPSKQYKNDVWHIPQSAATVALKTIGKKSSGLTKHGKSSYMIKEHPAPYPVQLPLALMMFMTGEGESVYDPFLGSGTTLIAAEKLGRRCYGMEIEPVYCDVIVERWQQFTGGKAKRGKA